MLKSGCAMVAGTLAMSGYKLTDTYYLGLVGTQPQAAMTYSFPVILILGCIFHGITVGITAPVSQALGRGDRDEAARLTSSGLLCLAVFSILLGAAGMATSHYAFALQGASGKTLEMVIAYMNIWFLGCVTSSIGSAGNGLLIATGDTFVASAMMIFGLVCNVILDPVFIFGFAGIPRMELSGAALATVISQFLSALFVLMVLRRRYRLVVFSGLPLESMVKRWGKILRFAVPATMGMLMMPIGTAIITRVASGFGDAAVAALGVGGKIEMLAFVFPMSVGMSLMPLVGQNFGACLYSRIDAARRFSTHFVEIFLLAMAVLYSVFARPLAGIFTKDPEVLEYTVLFLRIVPWGFWGIETHRFAGFFFTGVGLPNCAAWLNALRILVLLIPLSLLALLFNDVVVLFWARLASDITASLVGLCGARILTRGLPQDLQPHPEFIQRPWYLGFVNIFRMYPPKKELS